MRTTTRLVAAAALLAGGVAAAQPQVDPPLDELVREYRRLGLHGPPPDAELIRFGYWHDNPDRLSHLAFKTPPAKPGGWPRYWVGGRTWDRPQEPGHWEEPVGDGADGLRGLEPGEHPLLLAVQCRAHGRGELAQALYERERAGSWEREEDRTPSEILRAEAWYYWGVVRLNVVGANRREPLRRLRTLVAEDARFRTAEKLGLLGELEFTIESPPARPGSVEALIDSLTEYAGDAAPEGVAGRPTPGTGGWSSSGSTPSRRCSTTSTTRG